MNRQELLAEARKLSEKATPGPWAWQDLGSKGGPAWAVGQFYRVNDDADAPLLSGRVELEEYDEETQTFKRIADTDKIVCDAGTYHDDGPDVRDAAFIAAARTLVPDLADALAAADTELVALREKVARCEEMEARAKQCYLWKDARTDITVNYILYSEDGGSQSDARGGDK